MSKFKVELNRNGVKELLKSSEMKNICKEYADKAVSKLGEGYKAEAHDGKNRVNAAVVAVTQAAINENKKNNTVLKAVIGSD